MKLRYEKKLAASLALVLSLGGLSFGSVAQAADTKSDLVAHWTFDETYEESQNNLVTALGAGELEYTEGIFGKAAIFNGADTYLTVAADSVLNLGNSRTENNDNFTISVWLNMGDTKNNQWGYVLDKGNEVGWNNKVKYNNPYALAFNGARPYLYLDNLFQDTNKESKMETKGNTEVSGKSVDGEEWFLLTVTYEGKVVKIYRNDTLLMQKNYTAGITFNEEELYIGVDHQLKKFLKGAMDDLRLYTRTFSYDEVAALYKEGVSANKELLEPTKQLVAYYSFDGNLDDSSVFENQAEKVAVGGTTKYVIGKNGEAITMSEGNYILVPAKSQLNFSKEFTISCWLKLDENEVVPVLYRQNPSTGNANDNEYSYSLVAKSWSDFRNGQMRMKTRGYNKDSFMYSARKELSTTFTVKKQKLSPGDWFHYTCTYQDGEMKAYLNGKLLNKIKDTKYLDICNASGDLLIGYDGKNFLNGAMDELKIYNECLSATEVAKEAKRVDQVALSDKEQALVKSMKKGSSASLSSIEWTDIDEDRVSTIKSADKNVTFVSSNDSIMTVTDEGKVKAVKAGKAVLTIFYGGNQASYPVTVK